ncbi:hypothetical protein Dip518_001411 [Parelusimicrobium proximum]|uniref:hypothetical protein n=1 Tax=Parelusimicrobium proximum TaxID=3228953 RepID=UPI003D17CFC2
MKKIIILTMIFILGSLNCFANGEVYLICQPDKQVNSYYMKPTCTFYKSNKNGVKSILKESFNNIPFNTVLLTNGYSGKQVKTIEKNLSTNQVILEEKLTLVGQYNDKIKENNSKILELESKIQKSNTKIYSMESEDYEKLYENEIQAEYDAVKKPKVYYRASGQTQISQYLTDYAALATGWGGLNYYHATTPIFKNAERDMYFGKFCYKEDGKYTYRNMYGNNMTVNKYFVIKFADSYVNCFSTEVKKEFDKIESKYANKYKKEKRGAEAELISLKKEMETLTNQHLLLSEKIGIELRYLKDNNLLVVLEQVQ